MLTEQEIAQMFKKMGLASEEERARFVRLAMPGSEAETDEGQIFIRASATTSIEERTEDGELE